MLTEIFLITFGLIFVGSLLGVFFGPLQAWPRCGRGWDRKWVRFSIASAVVLAAVVAISVVWTINVSAD